MNFHSMDPNFRQRLTWFSQLLGFLFLTPSFNSCYSLDFVPVLLLFFPYMFSLRKLIHIYGFICHLYVDVFQICSVLSPRLQICISFVCHLYVVVSQIHPDLILGLSGLHHDESPFGYSIDISSSLCLKHNSSFSSTC